MSQKENIWDLLSGRSYHSCIITTYSFDFYYFEKNVMRTLRSKGIGNISVFLDSNIFQGILGNIGNSKSRIYSINQIKTKGAFHPKIYMFFGKEQGLLVIGSGNLTSSGHGKNDEIWGAFHFDANDPKYTQLFANSWSYLKVISQSTKGFTKEKIRWIEDYSPWVHTLPSASLSIFEKLDNTTEITFLSNSLGVTIFQQLFSLIPFNKVKEMTIIAPYFDSKGKIIETFRKVLPNAKINILVDEDNGILPFGLNNNIAESINFYHWKHCYKNREERSNLRLHAKLFNFVLKDNSQYCLFGSANASVAALGTENISAINDEVSILLKSSKRDFLKELSVLINSEKKELLSDFEKNMKESDFSINHSTFKYNIEAIDKEGNKLNLYTDKKVESDAVLHLFDSWGEEVFKGKLTAKNDHYILIMPIDISTPVYGCLKDPTTYDVLSNKQIIQDVIILSKTNPDPQKQVLDIIFSDIEQGDELLFAKLIDCISVNDLNIENKIAPSLIGRRRAGREKYEVEVKGEVLEYDEFKAVSYDSLQQQYQILNTNSNRIADFLSSFSRSRFTEEVASDAFDDEENDLNLTVTDGREDKAEVRTITKSVFKSMSSSIINFFERYDKHLEIKVNKMLEKSSQNITNESEVTLNELANFVVALYIAIIYTDKKIEYTENDKVNHDSIIKSFSLGAYIDLSSLSQSIIGKFLLLCTRNFKTYENEYVNERVERLRRDAFYNCVFCLVQASWSRLDVVYKNNLLINAIHFLPSDLEQMISLEQFTEEMKIRQNKSANKNINFISDVKAEIDKIIPRYLLFAHNMRLPVDERKTILSEDLRLGQTIFTSRFGFCNVKYKTIQSEGVILTFSRPGLPWDVNQNDFILKNWRPFKRNIIF